MASNEKIVTCENCEQDFVLKETDKRDYGEYGIAYVLCPNCKEKCYLEDEDSLKIDGNNLEFPKHFSKFGVSDGAVHIDDTKIQEWSRQALSHLIKHPEDHFYHIASGDSIVIGLQYDDEIYIVVGKNYHEFAYTKEEE